MNINHEEEDGEPLLCNGNISNPPPVADLLPQDEGNHVERYVSSVSLHASTSHSRQWATGASGSETASLATLVSDKKISDPRRTFCLFVLFDFLVTILLWLIECGVGTSGKVAFFNHLVGQFVHYKLSASLADVIILALCRFLFLEALYAYWRVRHYWPVAVSTAVSNLGLILKIFAIFITNGSFRYPASMTMIIVLLLTDFVLTWIEVWLIDSKVLPYEAKIAKKAAEAFQQQSNRGPPPVNQIIRQYPGYGAMSASEWGGYHSPAATPPPSESGYTAAGSMYYSMYGDERNISQQSPQESKLIEIGLESFTKLWDLYINENIWRKEKVTENGDVVYSTEIPEYGKTFRIDTNIAGFTPNVVFNEIVMKPEELPCWYNRVDDVKVLRKIGDQTSITREVSSAAAMGLISCREFITVRRVERRGETNISAGMSTELCNDLVPPSNYVRGVNGPTGFVVGPGEIGADSCKFVWILNSNLKGKLSRSLVNRNLTSTMVAYITQMKARLQATLTRHLV